jgi:hypothetical protein
MAIDTMAAKPQDRSYLAEIGDFLFATDTIAKIAKGEGTWGDAALVGVTAASFFIAPAKIMQLSGKALNAVIKTTSKTLADDATKNTMSVAARRAASKTLDDALTMKRQGYIPEKPVQRFGGDFDQPVERVGRAGMGEPTPAYEVGQSILKRGPKESDAAYAKRVKDYEEGIPTPAAKAERGMVEKKYSRTSDEDYNYYDRDIDAAQAAEDAIAMRGGKRSTNPVEPVTKPVTKEELLAESKLKEIQGSQYYDKTKFSKSEIDYRISQLTPEETKLLKRKQGESAKSHRQRLEDYVRGGDIEDLTPVPYATRAMRKTGEYTDDEIRESVSALRAYNKAKAELDAQEITNLYIAARRMLKEVKLNSKRVPEDRRISREDLRIIKKSFIELKKEFKEKVLKTAEGKALLKQLEKEMPSNPKSKDALVKFEENIADDAKPDELKVFISELIDDTPITTTAKGPATTKNAPVRLKTKIPDDLIKSYSFDDDLAKHNLRRAAALLAEKSRLNAFNAKNSTKLKTETNQKEISKLKQSSARNNKIIDRINDELRMSRKILSREEQIEAQNIADEVTKRNLAKRKEKYGPFEGPINPPRPIGKGGETAKLTKRGRIEKARAEVERLREEWKNTPASDTEARSRLAREAKKFADYIKKLEGK